MVNMKLVEVVTVLVLAGSSATLAQGSAVPAQFSLPQRGYQDQQPGYGPRGDNDERRQFEQRRRDDERRRDDRDRDQGYERGRRDDQRNARDQDVQRRQQQYNQNVTSLQQQRNQKVQALQQQFNQHQINQGQYNQATRQIDTELNESIAREQRALPR